MSYEPVQIKITKKDKLRVWGWLKEHNIANRGKFDGNKEKQFVGKLGECLVYRYMFGEEMELKDDGFDGGVDFEYEGLKVDVKTVGRTVFTKPHYENNFTKDQKDYKADVLLFASINKKKDVLEICGWLGKAEFLEMAKFYKKGDTIIRDNNTKLPVKEGFYACTNSQLKPINMLLGR